MSDIYTCGHIGSFGNDTGSVLGAAAQDPRILEFVGDHSLPADTEQALELIAYGYGCKADFHRLEPEFVERHYEELKVGASVHDLERTDLRYLRVSPDITPWFLAFLAFLATGRGADEYARKCSPEFIATYERAQNTFKYLPAGTFEACWEDRETDPDKLMNYLATEWLVDGARTDEADSAIDWLAERGEFAILGTSFDWEDQNCDTYIALARRAPAALKCLGRRQVECNSNTARDLFLMHGEGAKLDASMFEPNIAVAHWDQAAPTGYEWYDPRWRDILLAANELPKTPIPMFLLVELGKSIGDSQRFADHLDHVTRYCQGYDDYRTLYESLL